jgi:NAD(P)-dependent dehydrogenase (short-subunit alcohol dehydrogenase family)
MTPDDDPADLIDAIAETSNLATTAMLRAFAPRLRPGGRLIVVASALGTLDKLDDRITDRFAAVAAEDLDAVDDIVEEWRQAVRDGRADDEGFGTWLNIPSKVAQVAAVRAVAGERRASDLAHNRLVLALCPGLIDTDASRPWFDDMSEPRPRHRLGVCSACALRDVDPAFYGELVQFGRSFLGVRFRCRTWLRPDRAAEFGRARRRPSSPLSPPASSRPERKARTPTSDTPAARIFASAALPSRCRPAFVVIGAARAPCCGGRRAPSDRQLLGALAVTP